MEELTGQQLDNNTFKESNSLGYFYIEPGCIANVDCCLYVHTIIMRFFNLCFVHIRT